MSKTLVGDQLNRNFVAKRIRLRKHRFATV